MVKESHDLDNSVKSYSFLNLQGTFLPETLYNRCYKCVNISSQKYDSSLKLSWHDREMAYLSINISFAKVKILCRPKISREKCKQSFNFISLFCWTVRWIWKQAICDLFCSDPYPCYNSKKTFEIPIHYCRSVIKARRTWVSFCDQLRFAKNWRF